jgi:adenylyltransferase/sulfurtransferase
MLSEYQREKYSRQILIRDFTEEDLLHLIDASVLVIGAGGLGSPVLLYLVAAGIGKIGIVENDTIEIHNLQRQILYSADDVGKEKITKACERLKSFNPDCSIVEYNQNWTSENAKVIEKDYDIIVDCTDNIKSRLVSSAFSKKENIPFVYGAINGWEGQVSVFNYEEGKDYSETFGIDKNKTVEDKTIGVLGVTASTVGGVMASEVIKLIIGKGQTLSGKLLHVNLLYNQWNLYSL